MEGQEAEGQEAEGAAADSAAIAAGTEGDAVVAGGDDEPAADGEEDEGAGGEVKGAEGTGEEAKALAVRPQDGEAAATEGGEKETAETGFAIAEEEEETAADMGNSAAWTKLLMEAIAEPMPGAREKFEKIVTAFPTAATYWKPYLEKEMASGADGKVGPLFERCLRQCCSKELWRLYLRYVKQGAAAGQNARDELKTAYAFVAQHYGMDIGAAWFWHECVPLLPWLHLPSASTATI
eukprot:COSAG02_NODE_1321_length_13267_cov_16.225547_10_plen_237_part_00